jgi:hypothetical protein
VPRLKVEYLCPTRIAKLQERMPEPCKRPKEAVWGAVRGQLALPIRKEKWHQYECEIGNVRARLQGIIRHLTTAVWRTLLTSIRTSLSRRKASLTSGSVGILRSFRFGCRGLLKVRWTGSNGRTYGPSWLLFAI